jgi:hypothetical protein
MTRRFLAIAGITLSSAFWFNSCEVIVDFGLKDSTYELYDARIPGQFEGNALHLMLPGYVENDPAYRYIIHFYDNDRCTGTYYAADTLNYEVEGTWSLPGHDVLRIDLDNYSDGDFLMTKLEKDVFLLSTDENYIDIIQPDTIPLDFYIKRTH